jgi:hypothetical protein
MLVILGPEKILDASNRGLGVMADSALDPRLSTLDRGADATFGCGGAAP